MLLKSVYWVATATALLVMSPFILVVAGMFGAAKIWDKIELHAVYGGDEKARDKDRWHGNR